MSNPVLTRLRLAVVMVAFVYPVVTVYLVVLVPLTLDWAMWQRTLILVPMMVGTIVFGVSPLINRYFGGFVSGRRQAKTVA